MVTATAARKTGSTHHKNFNSLETRGGTDNMKEEAPFIEGAQTTHTFT